MTKNLLFAALTAAYLFSGTSSAGGRTDLLITADCGATPSDRTDDWAAIQNCLDLAKAAGGGVVYVPTGEFNVSKTLLLSGNGVTLEGIGRDSVISSSTLDGPVVLIDGIPPQGGQPGQPAQANRMIDLSITRREGGSSASTIDVRYR